MRSDFLDDRPAAPAERVSRREALFGLTAIAVAPVVARAREAEAELEVEGRAVCLRDGEPASPDGCSFGDPFAIQAADGTLHRLDPADPRVEILTDERVTAHPVRAALWVEDGVGKILRLYTIQDGEAIEPYYFCFTCNITSHIPGPCWCCQQEFEFKERPAPGADQPTR